MALQLIKFGGKWCAACQFMEQQRVLEQFAAVTRQVNVIKHEISEEEDLEDPVADAYDVNALPTLVFEDTESGLEVARHEGGISMRDLQALYAKAQAVASGEEKLSKKLQKFAPRPGGYEGVRKRAEQDIEGAPDNDEDGEDAVRLVEADLERTGRAAIRRPR